MERESNYNIQLPPGFRFHPSDQELIVHYLKTKTTSNTFPASIIAEVELYKFNPWELPNKALFGEEEWYFFTPRDRKYPNGTRPNRMTPSGYWKATGTDKPIFSSCGGKIIGIKKALMFYKGHPQQGVKTDWIMDEYRLPETIEWPSKRKGSMRLDDWVLCRVRQKSNIQRKIWDDRCGLSNDQTDYFQRVDKSSSTNTNPNIEMLGDSQDSLFQNCPMLPFIFGSRLDFLGMDTVSSISFEGSKTSTSVYDDYDQENLQVSFPSLNEGPNTRKRKPVERNQQEFSIQPSKKITVRDDPKDKVLSLSNNTSGMNFYRADQSGSNSFNADQWSSMMQDQEFNHVAFK